MEPQEVAGKEFLIGMRGYIREDVRSYLRAVAEELFRQHEVIEGLRRKLDDANRRLEEADWRLAEANGERAVEVDRPTLVKLVGEEASAILSSADGAAERIRFEAERYAASVRDGLVSTTDHLAELHTELGRLLVELASVEQQSRGIRVPPQGDVVLLGPEDEYPFGSEELRLDEERPDVPDYGVSN
ncbi:MAG: DivIVA domain-containing protein [Acidimicrobiia bacterium]